MSEPDLLAAVNVAFRTTGRGLTSWPDPHPARSPRDEEYSRLTNPERWRIVGARAEAWLVALTEAGLAEVDHIAAVEWVVPPGPAISRVDRVVPRTTGAIPLVVARTRLGEVGDGGVLLGVGDPAVEVGLFPSCGCDACDSGSQADLDHLDAHMIGIVSGRFRRLTRGDQEITTIGDGGWSASGWVRTLDVAQVLADPRGWNELTGTPWQ